MLLPLSAAVVQRKSLQHHLALAALKSGHGNLDFVGRLFRAIYLAYFVQDTRDDEKGGIDGHAIDALIEQLFL